MILKRIQVMTKLPDFTNCYIVQDEESKEAMVIDPGGEPDKILDMLYVLDAKVKDICITHCHGDHIGAVINIKEKMGGKVLIHRYDAEGLENDNISLASYIGMNNLELESDSRVDDNDLIHIGQIPFIVIHTPGHTVGSSSLYCKNETLVFTGDTLFRGTWGRTDLPTGNFESIMDSISKKILVLPEDTIVYPGHGKSTMIREEKPIYFNLEPRRD